jgi:hypothetical protein
MSTTAITPRPPLGLPAGSIRALLAIQIVLIFWVLLLVPSDQFVPIPLNLYFLLSLVMMFFVSHGKSIARHDEPATSPLWLPGGSIRFLILAGTAGVLIYTYVNRPENLDRLTPRQEDLANWTYYLGALGSGFVLGYITRVMPFRNAWAYQSFQAWVAIIAMAIIFFELIFRIFINPNLNVPVEARAWQTAVTAVVAFYYGSRS